MELDIVSTETSYYAKYLQSQQWENRRAAEIVRAGYRCEHCGVSKWSRVLQVHHLTYDHLGAELPGELMVLCAECHLAIHAMLPSFKVRRKYIEAHWKELNEKAKFLWGRDWWVYESEFSAIDRLTPLLPIEVRP